MERDPRRAKPSHLKPLLYALAEREYIDSQEASSGQTAGRKGDKSAAYTQRAWRLRCSERRSWSFRRARRRRRIDGQYIVVLKDNPRPRDRAKGKARTRGGRIQREFGRVLNGFTAKVDAKALAGVRRTPPWTTSNRPGRSRSATRRPTRPGAWTGSTSAICRSTAPTPTRHRRGCARVHHRHRHPLRPHRVRRPRPSGLRRRRRRQRRRLQRPRHARRRHRRRHHLRRRQVVLARRGAGARLQRQRHHSGVIAGINWVTNNQRPARRWRT